MSDGNFKEISTVAFIVYSHQFLEIHNTARILKQTSLSAAILSHITLRGVQ